MCFPATRVQEGRAEVFEKEAAEALASRERKPRSTWIQEERMVVFQRGLYLGHESRIAIIHLLTI